MECDLEKYFHTLMWGCSASTLQRTLRTSPIPKIIVVVTKVLCDNYMDLLIFHVLHMKINVLILAGYIRPFYPCFQYKTCANACAMAYAIFKRK